MPSRERSFTALYRTKPLEYVGAVTAFKCTYIVYGVHIATLNKVNGSIGQQF
jgi:hypothetical protein